MQVGEASEIEETAKEQEVEYETKESKWLDMFLVGLAPGRTGVDAVLDTVLEYECITRG